MNSYALGILLKISLYKLSIDFYIYYDYFMEFQETVSQKAKPIFKEKHVSTYSEGKILAIHLHFSWLAHQEQNTQISLGQSLAFYSLKIKFGRSVNTVSSLLQQ